MSKKLVTSYTFDASAQTIVAADFTTLEKIQLITNVTDNIIIYNFADATKGGSHAGTTLTLDYDTTTMDDADKLQIFVEDAAVAIPVTNTGTFVVQENGSALTALQLIDDPVATLGTTTYTETTSKGMVVGAVRRDADTTLVDTTNEISPLQVDAIGRLKTAASGNIASGATDSGNPVKVGGVYSSTKPTFTDGQRGDFGITTRSSVMVSLFANDSNINITNLSDNLDAQAVSATANKLAVLNRNTVYNGSTWDRMAGNTTGLFVIPKPTTSGGYTIFRSLDLDETEEDVKTSAGQLYGWFMYNNASSVRYVKIYNATAASVTVGATTPVLTIPLPANSGANVEFQTGIAFATAICAAATTGVADADTGAPAANDCIVNIFYT